VAASWGEAEQAATDGAELIHLAGGDYRGHEWGLPGVFIRNVPGQQVTVEKFVVTAADVTLGGVKIDTFQARTGARDATLYRAYMTGNYSILSGESGEDPVTAVLREVHRPDRGLVSDGDVIQVKQGASLLIEDSYIEGDDLEEGADGHSDTVQVLMGGLDLTVLRSFLGRSHNASIIEHGGRRIVIADSYIDWRKGPPPAEQGGGIGLEFRTVDLTVADSVSQRIFIRTDAAASEMDDVDIRGNRLALAGDLSNGGRIKLDGFRFADEFYPDNDFSVPDEEVPTPEWGEPSWWSELGPTAS